MATIRKSPIPRTECTIYIYHLVDPFTQRVRYVGQSSNPYRRALQHKTSCSADVREWMQSLIEKGAWPEVRIVAICKTGEEFAQEKEETVKVASSGEPLLNGMWVRPARRKAREPMETIAFKLTHREREALRALVTKESLPSEAAAARMCAIKQLRSAGLLSSRFF